MAGRTWQAMCVLLVVVSGCCRGRETQKPHTLPAFPPERPKAWVCAESPPPPTPAEIADWCEQHPLGQRGTPASLGVPGQLNELGKKNSYDLALQAFLTDYRYRELGWVRDSQWRLTGPVVGELTTANSYGVHPAVRIYYSPEMIDWMCAGRPDKIPDGAMLIKEMRNIETPISEYRKDNALGIDDKKECMKITRQPERVGEPGWAVMVRHKQFSHDGWYWAGFGPTNSAAGNPPIEDRSALTQKANLFFGSGQREAAWYPTGNSAKADVVYPYGLFGAYCLNCHASAEQFSTFASFDNILGPGLQFRHFSEPGGLPKATSGGGDHGVVQEPKGSSPYPTPASSVTPEFESFFGKLGPRHFSGALPLRFPAETFDHVPASPGQNTGFITSDNCIGCHDATNSNASTANMLVKDGDAPPVNVSPYGEWRVSPMGLAGRDPIFFSQLQSETNRLPKLKTCIENTCLHCHGIMGQRQFATDTAGGDTEGCETLFAVRPPSGVPLGKPFVRSQVSRWQDGAGGAEGPEEAAKYGALARDGISCAVCHRISAQTLGKEQSYTGNFVTLPASEVVGPYKDDTLAAKPMEHALGVTPKHGAQVTDSKMCASCHNILLPTLNNDGTPFEDPLTQLTASYEQTTDLEWQNSVYAQPGTDFRSCQDCHMPTRIHQRSLANSKIANIESAAFAPTTDRLPDPDITLTERPRFARHSLHGLNVFLNQMFQQFPLLLGLRQNDFMLESGVQPALLAGEASMREMATRETATLSLSRLSATAQGLEVEVLVTNLGGHYLPSGVGFRRVILELTVEDEAGGLLWASGRTNELGLILDGTGDTPLVTESGVGQRKFQPHYQVIERGDQVQIYQELIADSAGVLTTSFLRRVKHLKDNRLRPRGYDPQFFKTQFSSPYIQALAHTAGRAVDDPYYTDPKLTGADRVLYKIALTPERAKRAATVRVRLMNQSIPPFYLQERFDDARAGPGKEDIQRLYYLTSHLNTQVAGSSIESWKLHLATACQTLKGARCN